ncbi:unnamed protein product [Paramecium primaurelia]|uniref:Transmembrane protein n=1 Tax=Paramecium primaurelia TaxID=5886 RepID=A0A8S1LC79_PARPR|nr:unnamed protein product [Paramecium primaurelia]
MEQQQKIEIVNQSLININLLRIIIILAIVESFIRQFQFNSCKLLFYFRKIADIFKQYNQQLQFQNSKRMFSLYMELTLFLKSIDWIFHYTRPFMRIFTFRIQLIFNQNMSNYINRKKAE